MSEIRQLATVRQQCNASVIDRLEQALEQAKAGEIVAVGIAIVRADGTIARAWSDMERLGPLVGAVACLQHGLCNKLD